MTDRRRRLDRQLEFLIEIDRLKSVLRQTRISDGSRRENSAEHSWHIAMIAIVLAEYGPSALDLWRVVRMLLVHDIVEIDAGDTFAYDTAGKADQVEREQRAAERLLGLLPADQAAEWRSAWDEFEANTTPEAGFAHAIDRLQPFLLNIVHDGGTWRQHGVGRAAVDARMQPIADAAAELGDRVRELLDEGEAAGWFRE